MLAWPRLLCALVCFVAIPGWAATFTVNSTADVADASPGNGVCDTGRTVPGGQAECTLRAAVQEASAQAGSNQVVVPAGTYSLTLSTNCTPLGLSTRALCVSGQTTIAGAGASVTIVDAGAVERVMFVGAGANVTLQGLTLQNGLKSGPAFEGGGGGINNQGTLAISDSKLQNNNANTGGGGAIYSVGSLTITNSTLSNNTQIPNAGDGGGIFVDSAGTASITDTTFTGNAAGNGGGAIAFNTTGTATILRSTFSGNTAGAGGAIRAYRGSVTITNSTFVGNSSSGSGGALRNEQFGVFLLNNVTIAGNSAGLAGGGGIDGGTNTSMSNTILSGNTNSGNGQPQDCAGSINSLGYNLISSTTSCAIAGDTTGNITGASAQLGPLSSNGGATLTMPLIGTSPAVDAGAPAAPGSGGIACAATDQRGLARPQNGRCDVGAFERLAPGSCNYTVAPVDLHGVSVAGATPSLTVNVAAFCPLTVTSFQPWVVIGSIVTVGTTTTIQLQIAANATGSTRATSIVVGDRLFLVSQSGS